MQATLDFIELERELTCWNDPALERERMVIQDANEDTFEVEGLDASVALSDADIDCLAGCIITHNHPSGCGFSLMDLHLAISANVLELRAICGVPDGECRIHSLRRPEAGWSEIAIPEIADAHYRNIVREFSLEDLDVPCMTSHGAFEEALTERTRPAYAEYCIRVTAELATLQGARYEILA